MRFIKSGEPLYLDDSICEGLRLEEMLRSGKLSFSEPILAEDLSQIVQKLHYNIASILSLGRNYSVCELDAHRILSPGPAEATFVLAQKDGMLMPLLHKLTDFHLPKVVLTLHGEIHYESIVTHGKYEFLYRTSFKDRQIQILPSGYDGTVVVEKGSILFVCTPGLSSEGIALSLSNYLEPLKAQVSRKLYPYLKGKHISGNTIKINHPPPHEVLRAKPGGMLSIGIHTPSEICSSAPDMLLLGGSAVLDTDVAIIH